MTFDPSSRGSKLGAVPPPFVEQSRPPVELPDADAQDASLTLRRLEALSDAAAESMTVGRLQTATAGAGLSVLVVEPILDELLTTMSRLTSAGFRLTVADSFAHAKPLLLSQPPAVLLASVRLAAYNGLQLVMRGKMIRPHMATLLMSPSDDVVLRADAESMGATFLVRPLAEHDLIAAILRTVFRRDPADRPIRPPFERRRRERRAPVQPAQSVPEREDRRRLLPWLATKAR